jgi:spore germination protein KC
MSVVSGVAIDKGKSRDEYELTVEIVKIKAGENVENKAEYITLTGKSMFDIARNMITVNNKKLYWSHAKCIIISESVARDGIGDIIDWFVRDAEIRTDMYLLVSGEKTAKEILTCSSKDSKIISLDLSTQLKNQKIASRAPILDLWDFIDSLMQEGKSSSAPRVILSNKNKSSTPSIEGLAIFKKDHLVGMVDGTTTKYLLFALNQIKGGILTFYLNNENPIALEIFKNKTVVTPVIENDNIRINISTETWVSLAENQPRINFYTEQEKISLEKDTATILQSSISNSIRRLQEEYGSDVLGFGLRIYEEKPTAWKSIASNWDELFPKTQVSVNSKINIKNSATTSKPIKIGD